MVLVLPVLEVVVLLVVLVVVLLVVLVVVLQFSVVQVSQMYGGARFLNWLRTRRFLSRQVWATGLVLVL